jgi:NTE family protein
MGKTALVVSGGGSKGAFAVGVIKQLIASLPGFSPDIYIGTSTGSLIVPLLAAGQLPLLEKIYTTVKTSDIITTGNVVTRLMSAASLYDATPLANLINTNLTDAICQTIFGGAPQVFFCTTCLQTGASVNFSTQQPPANSTLIIQQLTSPDEMRHAVLASACQPVFMQPIEVPPGANPIRQYVDGGVREYVGVELAIEAGADEIYAIVLSPQDDPPVATTYNDAFTILERTIDIFTGGVGYDNLLVPMLYNEGLRYVADVKQKMLAGGITQAQLDNFFNVDATNRFQGRQPVKIFVIRPLQDLNAGPGGLDFDPTLMTQMMALGAQLLTNYLATRNPNGDGLA